MLQETKGVDSEQLLVGAVEVDLLVLDATYLEGLPQGEYCSEGRRVQRRSQGLHLDIGKRSRPCSFGHGLGLWQLSSPALIPNVTVVHLSRM